MEKVDYRIVAFDGEREIFTLSGDRNGPTQKEAAEKAFEQAAITALRVRRSKQLADCAVILLVVLPPPPPEEEMLNIIPEDAPYQWPPGRWVLTR